MDRTVFMMQATAEKNSRTINRIMYAAYALIVLMLAVLLVTKLRQLKRASVYINTLERIMPICAYCKKIREPPTPPEKQESWTAVEAYITTRSHSTFSYGLCPGCVKELYSDELYCDANPEEKP